MCRTQRQLRKRKSMYTGMFMAILCSAFSQETDAAANRSNNFTMMVDVESHQNITLLLDGLLNGYDKNLRPNFGGPPIVVEIDFNVRSMGPISEVDMTFSMDCYFRQTWIDKRLAFSGDLDTMTLGISTLEKMWKPDTYFFNGKQSYLHTTTVPNRLVRINQDGRVLYSQRLTVKASCPMNLENFPIDTQRCPLALGSFGYSVEDVIYQWNVHRRVVIASDMKMSQFDLISTPSLNDTTLLRNCEYSTLSVDFYLQRHTGYFLIQVYAPCMLLVVLSWVAFWINREATADRVALGVTTILTMTFLGLDSRNDLPRVSYATALDSFMAISFTFVFATIIQFALVHYYTKRGSGELYFIASDSSEEDEADEEVEGQEEEEENITTSEANNLTAVEVDDLNNKLEEGSTSGPPCDEVVHQNMIVLTPTNCCHPQQYQHHCVHFKPRHPHVSFAAVSGSCGKSDYACPPPASFCPKCPPNQLNHHNSASRPWHARETEERCYDYFCGFGRVVKCIRESVAFFRAFTTYTSEGDRGAGRRRHPSMEVPSKMSVQRPHHHQNRNLPNHPTPMKAATTTTKIHEQRQPRSRRTTTIDLEQFNSVSKIDSISRILFPMTFFVINLFYWYIYLSQNDLNGHDGQK